MIRNRRTGETRVVDDAGLQQYGVTPPAPKASSSSDGGNFFRDNPLVHGVLKTAADVAPELAGGIGGIAGGVAGTPLDIVSGPAGTLAGAGLGGYAGYAGGKAFQDAVRGLIGEKTQQGRPALETLNTFLGEKPLEEGAKQALFAAAPFSKALEGASFIPRVAGRGVIGALRGAATQALSNVQQRKPISEGMGLNTLVGGAAESLLPEAGSVVGALQKKVSQPLAERAGEVSAATKHAIQSVIGEGSEIRQLAEKHNLLPIDETGKLLEDLSPSTIQQKALDAASTVKEKLRNLITSSTEKVPSIRFDDVSTDLQKNLLGTLLSDNEKTSLEGQLLKMVGKGESGRNPELNISDLQQMKEQMSRSKWFKVDPISELDRARTAAYTTVKDKVEELTGQAGGNVRTLNQEISKLHEIANNAASVPKTTGTTTALTDIAKLQKSPLRSNPVIEGIASLLGAAGGTGLLHALAGPAGGSVGGLGGAFVGRHLGQNLAKNPETVQAISNMLSSGGQALQSPEARSALEQLIQHISASPSSSQQEQVPSIPQVQSPSGGTGDTLSQFGKPGGPVYRQLY